MGAERHIGVVLCRPLNYEAICTYAFYRYFAEELAHAGYAVLRFDYDGTGNSFGDDTEPNRVPAWQESINYAIDALREASGAGETVLFGMRLGATLAASVAAKRGDISGLILWGACPTGRSYLREMRALRAAHRAGNEAQEQGDTPAYEEAAGFVVTTETATDLEKLDATALDKRPASRALLIDRDDLPGEKRLGKRFAALGTSITPADWPGYAALMRDAQDAQMPETMIAESIVWLDRELFTVIPHYPRLTRGVLTQTRRLEAETYFEEPVLNSGSFGILTRPCARTPRSGTTVVLLSVGANPHIGPNRMYVTLARTLANQGFTVFRLDVTGVGDSARGNETGRDSIYSASARDDVRTTLNDLEKRTGADCFTLVGLCSGAYIAYQIASNDARVRAQVLLNVQAYEWQPGDLVEVRLSQSYKPTNTYLSSLSSSGTVKRLMRGQIDVKGILGALGGRLAERAKLEAKNVGSLLRFGRRYETSVCRALRQTGERGASTLFVFSSEDYGIEVTASHIGGSGQKIRSPYRPVIEIIEHSDHTFTQKAGRDQMLARIAQHLCDFFPNNRA